MKLVSVISQMAKKLISACKDENQVYYVFLIICSLLINANFTSDLN